MRFTPDHMYFDAVNIVEDLKNPNSLILSWFSYKKGKKVWFMKMLWFDPIAAKISFIWRNFVFQRLPWFITDRNFQDRMSNTSNFDIWFLPFYLILTHLYPNSDMGKSYFLGPRVQKCNLWMNIQCASTPHKNQIERNE